MTVRVRPKAPLPGRLAGRTTGLEPQNIGSNPIPVANNFKVMKMICKKCGKFFKVRQIIDGKVRIFNSRHYCLDCKPFGKKGKFRSSPTEEGLEYINKKCTICGREYKYHYRSKQGHTLTKCNSCLVNGRKYEVKKRMVEYKGGKCSICGYDKCNTALEFHHVDSDSKVSILGGYHSRSWDFLKAELDKCVLVCSNCHREIHANLNLRKRELSSIG